MRSSSSSFCSGALLLWLCGALPTPGQTFAASTGSDPVISPPEARAVRVNVPGHHRRSEEKLIFGRVRDGVYTVDGMTAKVQLNYDVNGVHFLYLFVPGVGTAVVSTTPDPDAVAEEATYKGTELSFKVGDHRFTLTGVTLATDKGGAPSQLFVTLDRSAWRLNRQPMIGFGNAHQLPYVWPGALAPQTASQTEETRIAPPVPAVLLPSAKPVTPALGAAPVDPSALHPLAFR